MLQTATYVVFFAFYFISLPAAYLFAFPMEWGMIGLWYGIVVGSIIEVILYFILLRFFCNWDKLAVEISERMKMKLTPNISMLRGEDHE